MRIWLHAAIALLLVTTVHARVIEIADTGVASGSTIRLRDIARRPEALPLDWAERAIGPAPAPGESRTLSLQAIAKALHQYDDMHEMILSGPVKATIRARTKTLDYEALDRALHAFMAESQSWQDQRFRVCRDDHAMPALPPGAQTFSIESIVTGDDHARPQLEAVARIEGRRIPEAGVLRLPLIEQRAFWSATRPITRGAVLREADLATQWLDASESARFYPATHPVEGKEARRNLRAGQTIIAGSLAEPVYARRGEIVRVTHSQGGLSVTLRARALSDGRRDERIACVNEQSGRRMHVRLVDIREAILEDVEGS